MICIFHGTINGIGERAGNAAIEEIERKCTIDIKINQVYNNSKLVSRLTGAYLQPNKAIVGENAFAHESGIHADGVAKIYEAFKKVTNIELSIMDDKMEYKELVNLDNVKILGFKADIKSINQTLNNINSLIDNYNLDDKQPIIQLMDAKVIAGKKHLKHGVIQSIKSFERGENLAKDLGIEILLRTSGQRQISKVFNIFGLKEEPMDIAVVMVDCLNETVDSLNDMFDRDDDVLDGDESILKEIYNITEKELDNVYIEDILIDKITNLIVEN